MWDWLNINAGAVGIMLAAIPIFWAIVEYVRKARSERIQQRFLNYHHLVADIVGRENVDVLFLDRQLAAIYELQSYPEYTSPTLKILEGLLERARGEPVRYSRLILQINETISALKGRMI
jgi:hypothetical protein